MSKQDCRIALVLSSSAAEEEKRPVVLRMFLSREEIRDCELDLISAMFLLNSSKIRIDKNDFLKIAEKSDSYKTIVEKLMDEKKISELFCYEEDEIYNLALNYLNEEESQRFIMDVRNYACSDSYNKVSKKADDRVRDLLLTRGYYKR